MATAPRKSTASTPQIGTTGLRNYGGFIEEEFLRDLKGDRANKIYREMGDNDSVCSAILFVITQLVRQVDWTVQAASEDQAGEDAAAFVQSAIFDDMDTGWDEFISEACTMFQFGHACMEMVWKFRRGPDTAEDDGRSQYNDGLLVPRAIQLRGQETLYRWEIDDFGKILGVHQNPWVGSQVFIPAERFLLFRTISIKNNPLGRSILRGAYRSWFFKKRTEEVEAIGVERDLAGYPVMRIPGRLMDGNASNDEKSIFTSYKSYVTRMRRNQTEGIVLPSDRDEHGNLLYELVLLASSGTRQIDTTKIVDRYDTRIAAVVLADFIMLGQKATGSFALSSDKTDLFATAVGAWLDSMADVMNNGIIGRMWEINKLDPALKPKLVHGDIESEDLGKLGEFISTLAAAGASLFPDRELENSLREKAGLPLAAEEAEGEDRAEAEGDDDDDGQDDDVEAEGAEE
jgi:hypothetical protein